MFSATISRALALACLLLFCSACTSVETRARVHPDLAAAADTTTLATSSFKWNAKRFNQAVFFYQIENAYQTAINGGNRRLVEAKSRHVHVDTDVFDWLLFDAPSPFGYAFDVHEQTFEINHTARFGFDLRTPEQSLQTRCGSFYLEESRVQQNNSTYKKITRNHDDFSEGETSFRVNSFVSCDIASQKQSILWSLELPFGGEPKFKINRPGNWQIVPLTAFVQHLSDGSRRDSEELPPWFNKIIGFEIYRDQEVLAAVALTEDPQLWVKRTLPEKLHQELTALMFALHVFNEVDSGWH